MENTARELMHNYVNGQKFSSTGEIMEAMKDLFRDALQQVLRVSLRSNLVTEKAKEYQKMAKIICRKTTETDTPKRA